MTQGPSMDSLFSSATSPGSNASSFFHSEPDTEIFASPPTTPTPAPRRLGRYILGETLGQGGMAKVKLGVDPSTGRKYAIKIMMGKDRDRMSDKHRRALYRALHAMQAVQHENVIRLFGWDENGNYPNPDGTHSKCVYTVLELATGGELFDLLMFVGHFDEVTCRCFFRQLCSGMKACHDAGIAHRDIKPENLLLDSRFQLKIADFGFAKQFRKGSMDYLMKTACGTRGYLSPELLRGEEYSEKCDIFACGIVLFTLYAGFPPFQHAVQTDWWFHKLSIKNYHLFWAAHERSRTFGDDLKDLHHHILASDPAERYSFDQIMEHEWVNRRILSPEELTEHLHHVQREKRKQNASNARKRRQEQKISSAHAHHFGPRDPTLPPDAPIINWGRHEAELGSKTVFEHVTDNVEHAAFLGVYHSFVSLADVRSTFARIRHVCIERQFKASLGEGKKVFMIRAGTERGNVLVSVRMYRLPSKDKYDVVFKRFKGSPLVYHEIIDLFLTDPFVMELMDLSAAREVRENPNEEREMVALE